MINGLQEDFMETVKISKGRHFLKKGDRIKGLFEYCRGVSALFIKMMR